MLNPATAAGVGSANARSGVAAKTSAEKVAGIKARSTPDKTPVETNAFNVRIRFAFGSLFIMINLPLQTLKRNTGRIN